MTVKSRSEVADGTLLIRTGEATGLRQIAFSGELDLANAATAEAELMAALTGSESHVIADIRQLEFIDSTGIAMLVAVLTRDGSSGRLSFFPSRAPGVNRVLELTGVAERLPQADEVAEELLSPPETSSGHAGSPPVRQRQRRS